MTPNQPAEVDDTYAEAFSSIYAEVLITARDRRWLDPPWRPRPATHRARSAAIAKPGWIDTSAREGSIRAPSCPRPMAGPARSCSSTSPGFAKIGSKPRAVAADADQSKRVDLPYGPLLQSAGHGALLQARAQVGAVRRRLSAPRGLAAKFGWCRSWAASSSSIAVSAFTMD